MIVFPETALSGYDNDLDHIGMDKMHCRIAETIPGPSTEQVAEIAKKYGMYIIFGMPEYKEGKVYNSAAIIEPNGNTYSYRKLHLPFDEKEWAIKGEEPVLIQTKWGPIGISICYDTYCFPELIRYYKAKGARLCINVTACPDAPCTENSAMLTIPAYSYVNYIYIASANLCGYDLRSRFIGGSSVVGSNYKKDGTISYIGKTFGEKDADTPGMYLGTIDLFLLDQHTDIPLFQKDEEGNCDFRAELYAKMYKELI